MFKKLSIKYVESGKNIIAIPEQKRVALEHYTDFPFFGYVDISDLRGVSKLHPDDLGKYNKEFGKALARKRLLKKFFNRIINELTAQILEEQKNLEDMLRLHHKEIKKYNRVVEVLNRMEEYSKEH